MTTTKQPELWVDLLAIPVADLERTLKLLKEREQLIDQLNAIAAVLDGPTKAPTKPAKFKASPFRDDVVGELARHPHGMPVIDLAKALGRKTKDVHSWFSNAGKKCGLFEKVAPGVWKLA